MTAEQQKPDFAAEVDFVLQYGGRCRDCADDGPICSRGLPCDPDQARKAVRFVMQALTYGRQHGYLAALKQAAEGPRDALWVDGNGDAVMVTRDGEITLMCGDKVATKTISEWLEQAAEGEKGEARGLRVKWQPRGIGKNWNIPDLVTGIADADLHADMSGFVRTKADGHLACAIFGGNAFLDFRKSEPEWIQVKVSGDEEILGRLYKLVRENDCWLTPEIVSAAISGAASPPSEPKAEVGGR